MFTNGFKPKTAKKIKVAKNANVTLDSKHSEFVEIFDKNDNEKIPNLKQEKTSLYEKINTESMTLEDKLSIRDRISEINNEIKLLRLKKKDYYLSNSKHVFEYFETKKNISNMETNAGGQKNSKIDTFFKLNTPSDTNQHTYNNIVKTYLSGIDQSFIDMNTFVKSSSVCEYCHAGELIPLEDEGILICNKCSRNTPYLIENEKPSYKEPPKEACFYAYKRINHFKEIIAQFQGKETTQIPLDVVENIRLQIKKERINLSHVTNIKTKDILKN